MDRILSARLALLPLLHEAGRDRGFKEFLAIVLRDGTRVVRFRGEVHPADELQGFDVGHQVGRQGDPHGDPGLLLVEQ